MAPSKPIWQDYLSRFWADRPWRHISVAELGFDAMFICYRSRSRSSRSRSGSSSRNGVVVVVVEEELVVVVVVVVVVIVLIVLVFAAAVVVCRRSRSITGPAAVSSEVKWLGREAE